MAGHIPGFETDPGRDGVRAAEALETDREMLLKLVWPLPTTLSLHLHFLDRISFSDFELHEDLWIL